jgi:hypothetical protein
VQNNSVGFCALFGLLAMRMLRFLIDPAGTPNVVALPGLGGRRALAAIFLAHSACQRATSKAALPMGLPSIIQSATM